MGVDTGLVEHTAPKPLPGKSGEFGFVQDLILYVVGNMVANGFRVSRAAV